MIMGSFGAICRKLPTIMKARREAAGLGTWVG